MAVSRVKVYDLEIEKMFRRNGEVGRYQRDLRRDMKTEAIRQSPKRSGDIARSHSDGGSLMSGRLRSRGYIRNSSGHASFVHEGTSGPIRPKTARFLRLPPGAGHPAIYARSVAGQAANPWIARAARTVLLRRGLL